MKGVFDPGKTGRLAPGDCHQDWQGRLLDNSRSFLAIWQTMQAASTWALSSASSIAAWHLAGLAQSPLSAAARLAKLVHLDRTRRIGYSQSPMRPPVALQIPLGR
jgi:hypothetical protein